MDGTGTMAAGRQRSGGHLLAATLVAQGVTHAFAVPGESFLDVLDGFYEERDRIRLVTCRFEAAAAHMAEACGKLTGRPAAAFVTRGPGACHAAIGVHVAFQDSTPMLLFVGQIPRLETDRESFQEVDYRRMFGPLAKWVTQIDDAARIPELVAHAVDVATSGRPGPVVIALSEEMQTDRVAAPPLGRAAVFRPHPDPAAMARLREMVQASRKPLAILGGGWGEQARAALRDWLIAADIPVAVAFRRQSLFPGTADNFVGDLGVGSDPALVAKAKDADLILALGTRLPEAVTQGYSLIGPPERQALIHVHPDPAEIGRVFRPALGIATALDPFAGALGALPPPVPDWGAWTRELRAIRLAGKAVPPYGGALNIAAVLHALEAELAPDAIMTCDAGINASWPVRFMHLSDGQRFLGPCNGSMGYAVPAAIGAKIAFPQRQVVAFVGDGGFLMTGQEIATAFHHGVAPIVLVLNNDMYGTIRAYQERAYPGRVSGTTLTNPDFAAIARAHGGHGETVRETEAFLPAFRRAVASGVAAVIEIRMDPEQITSRATIAQLRGAAGG